MGLPNNIARHQEAPLSTAGRVVETTDNASASDVVACRVFGAAGAAERLGVSVSTLKRGWPRGIYPAPIRISEHRIGWLESELAQFQRERVIERDARAMQKSA